VTALSTTLSSHRFTRRLFLCSVLVLLAGVIAVLVTVFGNTSPNTAPSPNPSPAPPARVAKPQPSVALAAEAKHVAGTFIQTAVVRKNLAEAWKISGPGIRQGLTRSQFLSGNIAVVPIVEPIVGATIFKTDYSHPTAAQVEVAVLVKPAGAKQGQVKLFYAGLRRLGRGAAAHWVVNSWAPWVPLAVRATP